MKTVIVAFVLCVCTFASAFALVQKIHPITSYQVVLLAPTEQNPESLGWISLKNGEADIGFIVFHDGPFGDPSLEGEKIRASMPLSSIAPIIGLLESEQKLEIRYFDPESEGVSPDVFIEPLRGERNASDDSELRELRRSLRQ